MDSYRIAAWQINCGPDSTPDENLCKIKSCLQQAVAAGAKLALFPELSLSGYTTNETDVLERARATGQAHAKELIIPILLYKAETNDNQFWKHIYRYQKALWVCLERYRDIPNISGIMGISHLEVAEIDRFYLAYENNSSPDREAIGIVLTGQLC